MFDRFTDRAKKVMNLARQEAQRFNHEYLGTEHLLLGIVREGTGTAISVLKNLEFSQKQLEAELVARMPPTENVLTLGEIPFSPQAKKVLELSVEEARLLGQNYIGTEHLLLGLVKEDSGIAAQVLKSFGLSLTMLRSSSGSALARRLTSSS